MSRLEEALKTRAKTVEDRDQIARQLSNAVVKSVYLHPGEMYASPEPANLTIILGSCVAVCIFNPRLSIGGATHYLLATPEGKPQASPRYGDMAINTLLRELRRLGSRNKDLRAHVYGGARMLQTIRGNAQESIGDKNVQLALRMLSEAAIPIDKRDTGGRKSRKVTMRTDTGSMSLTLVGN
jgi:chemotaxis protein CheD